MKSILWRGIRAARLAPFCLGLLVLAPARADIDHTTYIIRTPANDPATLQAIEDAGGIVDHFDGAHARAYILHDHWESFLRAGIPHEIEGMQPDPSKQLGAYPSYDEVSATLADRAARYPGVSLLTSIGRSVQGRELWAMQITANPGVDEDEPEFAYLSTMHGDEPVGTVLCLNLIDLLLEGYGHDPALTALVDSTEIWILPLINPDGYELGIRWNANNVDLNRAFPQWPTDFSGTIADGTPDGAGRQPEVARIMAWAASRRLVLSANYHTGALVVNYPYDEEPGIPSGSDAPTPDDPLVRFLSAEYASRNPPMLASPVFPGGISNGSAWFSISGGMQDWHYRFNGTIDLTLEVSNIKSPGQHTLASLWDDNRDAMIAYLDLAHRGIRGRVTSRTGGEPLFATVTLNGNPQPVFTDPAVGDYHRLALPGTYTVRAEAPGYIPYSRSGIAVGVGAAVRADLALSQGDVNGDGRVDALDLQLVINTILGLADIPAADVDGNGVSATDLQHLVNRVLRRP